MTERAPVISASIVWMFLLLMPVIWLPCALIGWSIGATIALEMSFGPLTYWLGVANGIDTNMIKLGQTGTFTALDDLNMAIRVFSVLPYVLGIVLSIMLSYLTAYEISARRIARRAGRGTMFAFDTTRQRDTLQPGE